MKLLLCAAVAAAAGALSSSALASDPMGVFARVDSVEYEPTKGAATRVVIRGVFGLHQGNVPFTYGAPIPGYMYYACPADLEADCREQWADIEAAIAVKTVCVGWGQQLTPVGTVRSAGTSPQNPDFYELGMGVTQASKAGGICPKLLSYTASTPGADAGAPPDPVPVPDKNDGGRATPTNSDAGAQTTTGTGAGNGANDTVTSGCAVSSGKTGGSMLAAGLAAAAFVLGRRRRAKGAR